MEEQNKKEFSRTRMLLGGEGMRRLKHARVAVFGVGGVGSYAVEALAEWRGQFGFGGCGYR